MINTDTASAEEGAGHMLRHTDFRCRKYTTTTTTTTTTADNCTRGRIEASPASDAVCVLWRRLCLTTLWGNLARRHRVGVVGSCIESTAALSARTTRYCAHSRIRQDLLVNHFSFRCEGTVEPTTTCCAGSSRGAAYPTDWWCGDTDCCPCRRTWCWFQGVRRRGWYGGWYGG